VVRHVETPSWQNLPQKVSRRSVEDETEQEHKSAVQCNSLAITRLLTIRNDLAALRARVLSVGMNDHSSKTVQRLKGGEESTSVRPDRRSFLQGAGLLLASGLGEWARSESALPSMPLFKIERVSSHVYAAIALTTPVVNGNSAIIVTKKGLVIVDSQSWPSGARSLYNQFKREVAALPVRYAINTHHHLDHAHGNEAYAQLFGTQLDIVSTTFARAALEQAARWFRGFVQRRPVPLSQLQEVPNQERYYAFVESYIGGLRDSIPTTEVQIPHLLGRERATAQSRLDGLRSYFSEMSTFAPALPNITFDRKLVLHCDDVTVEVRYLGRGHTAGDAVVFIPEDRVIATGDLVHGLEPLLLEAFPDEWPATLERLSELDFQVLVPGHGPVHQGRTILTLFKDYLMELNQLVFEGVSAGKSLPMLQAELLPERFRSLQKGDFGQALQRNRETLLGLPPGQPLEPIVSSAVEQVYYYYAKKQKALPR
jgi:cyclase